MEDQEKLTPEEQKDVEAHGGGKGKKVMASDEPKSEGESDDDFELHGGGGKKKTY